jgi:hypothetical protein
VTGRERTLDPFHHHSSSRPNSLSIITFIDPRRIPGAIIEAKAIHIKSEAEAGRSFGGQKQSKMILGVDKEVHITKNQETGRTQTTITADFELALGVIKRKTLHIKSVRVPPVNGPEVAPPCHVVLVNNNNTAEGGINHDSLVNNPQVEMETPSNDNHDPFGMFNVTINQQAPSETTEGLPVANLFPQETQQSPICISHGMEWIFGRCECSP